MVENFNNKQIDQIINLKKNNQIKIILVQTEFINEEINAFNCFDLNGENNIQSKAFFFNLIIRYLRTRFYVKKSS